MSVYADATNSAFLYASRLEIKDENHLPVPFFWPNVDASNKPDSTHIKVSMRKTQPDKQTIEPGDCATLYIWILQLLVCVENNVGEIIPEDIIDQIVESFQFAQVFGTDKCHLKIMEVPYVASGVSADGWVSHPVQIRLMKTDNPVTNGLGFEQLPDDDDFLLGTVDW